jgi:hypothetical protein
VICASVHIHETFFFLVARRLNNPQLCILATSSMAEMANTYRVKIYGDIYWYCAVIWGYDLLSR